MKKVSIINKYGPSSKAITGRNAKEIADYLYLNNFEVTYICLRSQYKSEAAEANNYEEQFKVKELRNYYKGGTSLWRLLWGFIDGFRLWLASFKQQADIVIVLTDPPLLIFWFQLLRKFSNRKLFYWTMDIYPDAFAAGKYIKPANFFYRFFSSIIYGRLPDLIIALGDKQLEFLEKKFRHHVAHVILPCGIIETNANNGSSSNCNGKITFGYGGNIGEAHDADFLISLIKQLDPEKHEIILSLYGSKAAYVKQQIQNTEVVQYKDFLNFKDIASIDVNIATILPEWNHICVPSKAVTAICCGSSLLLNGTKETDAWNMFKNASWLIEADKNYESEIKTTIDVITIDEIFTKRVKAKELSKNLVEEKVKALQSIVLAIQNNN